MSDDTVDSSVVESSAYILRFGFLVEVCAEMVFFCYIYVDVIGESVTNGTFSSTDLALFLKCILSYRDT